MGNINNTIVFAVMARRWGRLNTHSYLVGVYSTLEMAIKAADSETEWRGGKYSCWVEEIYQDTFYSDDTGGIVYKTECQNMA